MIPTKLPAPATAELPAGSQWTLIADFPGYFATNSIFSAPQALEPGQGNVTVQVTLRPAATLSGKFVVAAKEKLPENLEIRFEPNRGLRAKKQDLPPGSAPCAVGPTGDWRCRVPAGRLDMALHPKGFVPHYLWDLNLAAGESKTIEPLKLVRGASIAGWVTQEDGSPAEKCRVRLEPVMAPGRPNDPVMDFLRSVASEASCRKKGFFQFSGVRAGAYAVVAVEKEARAQLSPVEVWDGAESRLTVPIVLRRPMDFEVTLNPPTDWLGKPWRFESRRANEYRAGWEEPSFRAETDEQGRVHIPKQSPGRFWITVYDRAGNAVFSDPHADLTDPGKPYPIDLDLLWVTGTVRLGDEPVSARLFFGGRSGATSIEMNSDAEGHFQGPLPKPGSWRVDVEATKPDLKTSVRVAVKPKSGRATVVIELPGTKVSGRVVDPAGKPAARAEVSISSPITTLVTNTDEKGEFELRAFPEGTTELSASRSATDGGREVSDAYLFEASGQSPHGPVVLTLKRNRVLRGKVLAPTGPVVGATVSVWPSQGGDGVVSAVRSGLDGSFELRVPVGTQRVRAIVSPPGGALKAYELPVDGDAAVLLQVEPEGGELVVDVGKNELSGERTLTFWQDGIGLPGGTLARWAEGHGVRYLQGNEVHVPHLAPGQYTVCLGAAALFAQNEIEDWKSRASCTSGYLAGSGLGLRLP
ncbi:MAG: carboxypeptidase regulatory-like domain-containing protein [Thermoanaerobaculia bacterium]